MRDILLFLHIAAAIIIVGGVLFIGMLVPGMVRGGRDYLPALRRLSRLGRIFGPSTAVVFLLGIALVIRNKAIDFSDGWVGASMALFIIASALGGGPTAKTLDRAITKIDDGHPADAEASRLGMLGGISVLIVVVIVYLMVVKPGA
jgi:uncharacterized membrane protein